MKEANRRSQILSRRGLRRVLNEMVYGIGSRNFRDFEKLRSLRHATFKESKFSQYIVGKLPRAPDSQLVAVDILFAR